MSDVKTARTKAYISYEIKAAGTAEFTSSLAQIQSY